LNISETLNNKSMVPMVEGTELDQYEAWIRRTAAGITDALRPISFYKNSIINNMEILVSSPLVRPAGTAPDSAGEGVDEEQRTMW
jgi:hypothetical protein